MFMFACALMRSSLEKGESAVVQQIRQWNRKYKLVSPLVFFSKPDFPIIVHKSLPKLKKKKTIRGLAQARIPAKIDFQLD